MKATRFEYRFRFIIHALIFVLGFSSPWVKRSSFTAKSLWVTLASSFAEQRWLSFFASVDLLLVLALLFLVLGALFRTWGAAYVGSGIVGSRDMHGERLLADGPYRHTRNPLYLGTIFHTIGISLLMPVSGALLTVALIWFFQIRLALAEEPFLGQRFGQAYLDYKAHVPRFLPMLAAQVPAGGQKPKWLQAVLGELYSILVVFVMAIFGWSFNAQQLIRGILISLGVWIIVRAFLPRPAQE